MNKIACAYGILKELEDEGQRHGVASITHVHVRMGSFCDIVPDELTFVFNVLSEGTVAEGAEMNIDIVPAEGQCRHCGQDVHVDRKGDQIFFCTQCGGPVDELISGRQLEVALIRGEALGAL